MSALEKIGREHGLYYSADELVTTYFPPARWAVLGLVPEGLTLFGGPPKVGKSFIALGIALCIAGGTPVLGKIDADPGPVLYAALEDPARRLKSRLETILGGQPAPANLALILNLPPMPEALGLISGWLDDHLDARLVIIDVLQKIRPAAPTSSASMYGHDYLVMSELKRLADKYQVAVIVITHLRKMGGDGDVFNEISGSTGLTGAADTSMVIKRVRGEAAATLHITGRDVLESEYAITFDPIRCTWSLDGDALVDAANKAREYRATAGLGDRSIEIIRILGNHPDGLGPTALGTMLGIKAGDAGNYLKRLVESGRIVQTARGLYGVERVESVESAGQSLGSVSTDTGGGVETPDAPLPRFDAFDGFDTPTGGGW